MTSKEKCFACIELCRIWKMSCPNLIFIALSQNENVQSTTYMLIKTKYLMLSTKIYSTILHAIGVNKEKKQTKPDANFLMGNMVLSILFFLMPLFSWRVSWKKVLRLKSWNIASVNCTEKAEFGMISNHLAQLSNIRKMFTFKIICRGCLASILFFQDNNSNTRTMREICSKLTIKHHSDISGVSLVSLLLTWFDFRHCFGVSIVDFE